MSDLLREATQALREEGGEPADRAQSTRARVMMSLHARRQRRARTATIVVPLFALLAGSTAWASASGALSSAWSTVAAAVGISKSLPAEATPSPRPKRSGATSPARRDVSPPAADTTQSEAADLSATPSHDSPRNQPHASGVSRGPVERPAPRAASASSAPGTAAPVEDATLVLYRAAHRAHFVDRDSVRALAAWDAYLAEAPSGQLAPEARYNRALTLVRLNRYAEAKRALEPFASGGFAGYRQREATALIEEIDGESSRK
jgi:hypothetical protein